jgi:hypothetical protein
MAVAPSRRTGHSALLGDIWPYVANEPERIVGV